MISSLRRFENARINFTNYGELANVDRYGFRIKNDDGSALSSIDSDMVILGKLFVMQGIAINRVSTDLPDMLPNMRCIPSLLDKYTLEVKKKNRHIPEIYTLKAYFDRIRIIRFAAPYEVMLADGGYFNIWKLVDA